MSEDDEAPPFPRFGCKFCTSSYISRGLLNRHLDHYLFEYASAYHLKSVKTSLIKCHPLQVIRALRSQSGRHNNTMIEWEDLIFTPWDRELDLAVILVCSLRCCGLGRTDEE